MSDKSYREQIYDDEIAPLLKKAAELCSYHRLPFIAVVEYDNGDYGRTECMIGETASLPMKILRWAALAKDNVDALFIPICRYAKEHGHNSIYLSILGEKYKP